MRQLEWTASMICKEMVRDVVEKVMEMSHRSASNRSSQDEVGKGQSNGSPRRIPEREGTWGQEEHPNLKTLTGADENTSGGYEEMNAPGEERRDRAPGRAILDEADKGQSNRSPKLFLRRIIGGRMNILS